MDFVSTRGGGSPVSFTEAFAQGLAPDGGLFVPKHLPMLSSDILVEDALPYAALAWDFLSLFDSDHDSEHLIDIIDRSYGNFSDTMNAPLQQLADNLFVLELFHGPSLSFKDFGLQLIGSLFEEQIERTGKTINVLGATSGDTGAAAIHGLMGKKGANVFILYPEGRISELQERQMTCTGAANIFPIPIKGTFDDAQAIVKELMGDLSFKEEMRLSAINSINVVRVLAQSVYYIHAYTQLPSENRDDLNFVVPTGNFGNIFAGWMVHQMGLPVDQFVVATNQNDILYRLFTTGEYRPDAVHPSHAPSMDIQVASNFERFLYYHNEKNAKATLSLMEQFKKDGSIKIPNFNASNFTASRSSDEDILANIRRVKEDYDYVIDPHTACGFQDLDPSKTHVVLATAHPAKFPEIINAAIGETPTEPSLEAIRKKSMVTYPVEATAAAVREFLEKHAL
ncbi:MAG: threonine synthase [Verrucomicrobiales bacterium]|jgi:threonine synthase|nr:threonine synthase [Verrucomicrobiales bacterium]MBP9224781.1 threonine synthase [Verrucomicrobiales bacterium]HQZ30040.1 threonine synthase [Verrucomicrobiales bacterium]